MDAARALQDFLATLSAERNASRHTLDAYRRDLADFFALLGRRRVTAAAAGPDDVVAWMESQRKAGRKALIPYITAGDPSPAMTVPLMRALVEAGADILELGVPFSDPMADGPVVQRSGERALKHGVGLHRVLEMA